MRTIKQSVLLPILAGSLLLAGCGVQSIPKAENQVAAAWGEVQNQYQRRADLVPNLVNVVKGYAKHEKETLQAVTDARSKATQTVLQVDQLTPETMKRYEQAQKQLSGALGRLLAVAERYPDLKASANFRDLQVQLEGTENRIAIARRRYIEAVQHFNNQITVPPMSFTNAIFYHKTVKPQFTATAENADKAPEVHF